MRWVEQRARCDQCGQEIILPNGDSEKKPLPCPWREVTLPGWVAQFVACGDECEKKFRARYERPEKRSTTPPRAQSKAVVPTPVPSEPPPSYDSDEDTNPSIVTPAIPSDGNDGPTS